MGVREERECECLCEFVGECACKSLVEFKKCRINRRAFTMPLIRACAEADATGPAEEVELPCYVVNDIQQRDCSRRAKEQASRDLKSPDAGMYACLHSNLSRYLDVCGVAPRRLLIAMDGRIACSR